MASVLGEDNAGGALDLCRLVQAMTRTHILSTLMGSSLIETRGGEATLAVLLQQMDIRSRQDPCTRETEVILSCRRQPLVTVHISSGESAERVPTQ